MIGSRSSIFLLLAGVVISLLAISSPQPRLDLELLNTGHGLSVMRYEVTIAQWNACYSEGGCSYQPSRGPGAKDDNYPVTGVGALDAHEFVAWAQKRIDPALRLPTLEEWYSVSGIAPIRLEKIFTDPRLAWAATYGSEGKVDPTLRKSGGFGSGPVGLADMKGNVWEWTATCVATISFERCPAFYVAGEHETRIPVYVRDPESGGCATGTPPAYLGLRLVRTD